MLYFCCANLGAAITRSRTGGPIVRLRCSGHRRRQVGYRDLRLLQVEHEQTGTSVEGVPVFAEIAATTDQMHSQEKVLLAPRMSWNGANTMTETVLQQQFSRDQPDVKSVKGDHALNGAGARYIMVVDDQPFNLKLMEDILVLQGYEVRSFPRGRLALAAVTENPPDLILLDVTMPEMDGFEVCRRLRSDAAFSKIPVIFLSALEDSEDKIEAFNSGGFDYVTKPFKPDELLARITTQLKLRSLQEALDRRNCELKELVQQQVQQIAAAQMATIFALAKLAESRDEATGRHLERVQMLCRLLGTELRNFPKFSGRMTDDYVNDIFLSSPLHDIGKVAIPDSILLKPGSLTPEEFAVMKRHTVFGSETLEFVLEKHPSNSFIRMGIEIARSHHEKWNGSGYPAGLIGEQIPLSARIMAVADCYDALRSQRCYKKAKSHEESRGIILGDSGSHFDSDVVLAFRNIEDACRDVVDRMT
jgi:putative two-component system response regulator